MGNKGRASHFIHAAGHRINQFGHTIKPYWELGSQIIGMLPHPMAQKIAAGMTGISAVNELRQGKIKEGIAKGAESAMHYGIGSALTPSADSRKRANLEDLETQGLTKKLRPNPTPAMVIQQNPAPPVTPWANNPKNMNYQPAPPKGGRTFDLSELPIAPRRRGGRY